MLRTLLALFYWILATILWCKHYVYLHLFRLLVCIMYWIQALNLTLADSRDNAHPKQPYGLHMVECLINIKTIFDIQQHSPMSKWIEWDLLKTLPHLMLFSGDVQWSLCLPGFCDDNLSVLISQYLINLPWPGGSVSGISTMRYIHFDKIQKSLMKSAANRYVHKQNHYNGMGGNNYKFCHLLITCHIDQILHQDSWIPNKCRHIEQST